MSSPSPPNSPPPGATGSIEFVAETAVLCSNSLLVLFSLIITVYTLTQPERLSLKPPIRGYSIFIVMMPLSFSICSLIVGVWGEDPFGVFEIIRDTYEGIVIYLFFKMLMWKLGGLAEFDKIIVENREGREKSSRCTCCTHRMIQVVVFQFVIVKPLTSIGTVVVGLFAEHTFNIPWITIRIITFLSTTIALGALFITYRLTRKYLLHFKTDKKFLAIKILVALTLLQSTVFNFLESNHVITEHFTRLLEQFLIITEMFPLTVMFFEVFPASHFKKDLMAEYEEATAKEGFLYGNNEQ